MINDKNNNISSESNFSSQLKEKKIEAKNTRKAKEQQTNFKKNNYNQNTVLPFNSGFGMRGTNGRDSQDLNEGQRSNENETKRDMGGKNTGVVGKLGNARALASKAKEKGAKGAKRAEKTVKAVKSGMKLMKIFKFATIGVTVLQIIFIIGGTILFVGFLYVGAETLLDALKDPIGTFAILTKMLIGTVTSD